jgi:hypothetical protein
VNASEATLFTLNNQILDLRTKLLAKHPGLGTLLAEIKKALEQHPENVTLLKEEEFATIFDAIKSETGIQFAAETTKSAKSQTGLKALKGKINTLGSEAF